MKHPSSEGCFIFFVKIHYNDITPIARCDAMQYKKVQLTRYFYRAVIDVDELAVVGCLLLLLEVKIDK